MNQKPTSHEPLPIAPLEQVIMVLTNLNGTAYVERQGKLYMLSGKRPPGKKNQERFGIAHEDFMWLKPGSTADIIRIEASGKIVDELRIGRNYETRASYKRLHSQLTSEQLAELRNLLVQSGNGKPVDNPALARLLLPLPDSVVRAGFIPYWFWRGRGAAATKVEARYLRSGGDIVLGVWPVPRAGYGTLALSRSAVVARLQKAYNEQGTWDKEQIPLSLVLKTSRNSTFVAANLSLATEEQARAAVTNIQLLEKLLADPTGSFVALARLTTWLEQEGLMPEYLYRLRQHLAKVGYSATYARELFRGHCEQEGIDADAWLTASGR